MTSVLGRLRSVATENLNLKVLSVLLAILIHIVVQRDNVREFAFPVPLALQNVRPGWVFVGERPDRVQVRVRGRWSGIRELAAGKTQRLIADLKDYRDGERFVLDHRTVQTQLSASGIEVLSVQHI